MQVFKVLKIFFWFPAVALLFSFRCVTHLCAFFYMHLQGCRCKLPVNLFASFVCIFLIYIHGNAQTDTAFVDTTSMARVDSTGIENKSYTGLQEKHIYDTSQDFFNWKNYSDDPYATEKLRQRPLPDSTIQKFKTADDFWYIPAIEKIETRLKNDPAFRDSLLKANLAALSEERSRQSITQQQWFRIMIWCIIIGVFLSAVIYFLVQNKINLFSKESKGAAFDTDSSHANVNIFHLSYTELLRKAEQDQDYRSAVRLLYLQTLKLLSEATIIHYQPDYTNLEYIQQLYQTKFYDEFFSVTRHYEYVWYGKFEISKELFGKMKHDFRAVQNKLAA